MRLVEEIEALDRCRVVGVTFCPGADMTCLTLRAGDEVLLEHEQDNPHDPNAYRVVWQGKKIGYLPREVAAVVNRRKHGEILGKEDLPVKGVVLGLATHWGSPTIDIRIEFGRWNSEEQDLRLCFYEPREFELAAEFKFRDELHLKIYILDRSIYGNCYVARTIVDDCHLDSLCGTERMHRLLSKLNDLKFPMHEFISLSLPPENEVEEQIIRIRGPLTELCVKWLDDDVPACWKQAYQLGWEISYEVCRHGIPLVAHKQELLKRMRGEDLPIGEREVVDENKGRVREVYDVGRLDWMDGCGYCDNYPCASVRVLANGRLYGLDGKISAVAAYGSASGHIYGENEKGCYVSDPRVMLCYYAALLVYRNAIAEVVPCDIAYDDAFAILRKYGFRTRFTLPLSADEDAYRKFDLIIKDMKKYRSKFVKRALSDKVKGWCGR